MNPKHEEEGMDMDNSSQPQKGAGRKILLLNAILVFIVCVMAWSWYYWHVSYWIKGSVFATSTLMLWTVYKALSGFFKFSPKEQARTVTIRLLGSVTATEALILLICLMAPFFFSTKSISFHYEGAGPNERNFEIDVRQNGMPVFPPIAISALERSHWELLGQRWRDLDLEVLLKGSRSYEPLRTHLGLFAHPSVKVPGDFTPVHFVIVRLVPGLSIVGKLPSSYEHIERPYFMKIDAGEDTLMIEKLLKQEVILGAGINELQSALSGKNEILRLILRNYLQNKGVMDNIDQWINNWTAMRLLLDSRLLRGNDTLNIVVQSADHDRTLVDTCYVVPSDSDLVTIFLEGKNEY
jgi:hypothetical protein